MSKRLIPFKGSEHTRAAFFAARPLFDILGAASFVVHGPSEIARFLDLAHPHMVCHYLLLLSFYNHLSRYYSREPLKREIVNRMETPESSRLSSMLGPELAQISSTPTGVCG